MSLSDGAPCVRSPRDGDSIVLGAYSSLSSAFYAHSSRSYRESALRETSSPTPSESLTFISEPSSSVLDSETSLSSRSLPERAHLLYSPPNVSGKPITELSPSTPFQSLFMSSPTGFWNASISSVSPVFRRPSSPDLRPQKIQSLAHYQQQPPFDPSPSSSSLSSVPSSPFDDSPGRPLSAVLASRLARSSLDDRLAPNRHPCPTDPVDSPNRTHHMRTIDSPGRPSRYSTRARTRLGQRQEGSHLKQAITALSDADADADGETDSEFETKKRSTRKRPLPDARAAPTRKKARSDSPETEAADDEDPSLPQAFPQRTFPASTPIKDEFSLFYRRFPASSYYKTDEGPSGALKQLSDATYNPPRNVLDLYTPRYVKGRGVSKVGLCPCCCESRKRGGDGKKLWLSMKFSAFKCYHMQYAHGISVVTGRPFSPPTAFRTISRHHIGKHEKASLMQGKCHKCQSWVAIEGIKDVPTKVKEIYWWKHAAACHQGSTIEGECDVYVEDDVYRTVLSFEGASSNEDADE